MKIDSVEIAFCPIPLVRPFSLGTMRLLTRDYVVLRIRTDQGCDGYGIGFRGGTQIVETLTALIPSLLGRDPLMRRETVMSIEEAMVPGRTTVQRALSFVDLALWDIAAKSAGLPLYRLLGGFRQQIQTLAVAGYSYAERGNAAVVNEVLALAESGVSMIKIMLAGQDAAADAAYVTEIARALGHRATLVVDAHWSWRTLPAAMATCARIDDLGLGFIEDPFLPQQWRLTAELRSKLKTPLAAGEDTLDLNGFMDQIGSIDVLRVDATTGGGITGASAALSLASAFGRMVVPHGFPFIHGQLACSYPAISAVEYIPYETEADPIDILFESPPSLANGIYVVSESPGIGLALDWTAVAANAKIVRKS